MRLLLILPSVPHPGNRLAGAPNARSARVLADLCDHLVAVAPRPWAPRWLQFHPKWRSYGQISAEVSLGPLVVHRPAVLTLPLLGGRSLAERLRTGSVKRLLERTPAPRGFDAVLSFDLLGCGGVAWRLGRYLGVPSAGWAVGSDVRVPPSSPRGRVLAQTIRNLDVVFYQSDELCGIGRKLVGAGDESDAKHKVRSRGIIIPGALPGPEVRASVRAGLGFGGADRVALYVGRIVRDKGLFDLVDAMAGMPNAHRPRLLMVGAVPAYDSTGELQTRIREAGLSERDVRILPACGPEEVWRYYAASDMYVFPSFREGMPNSVLEAMAAGLPVVAFDIPAIRSINGSDPAVDVVPVGAFEQMTARIRVLADDDDARVAAGRRAGILVRSRFDMRNTMRSALEDLQLLSRVSSPKPEENN